MSTFRLATFNCENLFSRPKIFGASKKRSLELLEYVKLLQEELCKEVFDHNRISELKKKLSGYATIQDVRGKHTSAPGKKEWLGWVELTRRKADDVAIDNTAQVITDVNADIVCPIEVENRIVLQHFHDDLLKKQCLEPQNRDPYNYILLVDGNDSRGIDVSVMSRFPVSWIRSHIHETTDYNGRKIKTFSRDCLEATIQLPNNKNLLVMVNHLKSMGYSPGNDPLSNNRRKGQAKRIAELLDEHNLQEEYVAVVGDLNSDPSSPSLAPLLNKEGLYNVNLQLPPKERGTYKTGKQQLDYILISDALKAKLANVYIERRGVYSKTKWVPYKTVTGRRTEASDHAVVVADFNLA